LFVSVYIAYFVYAMPNIPGRWTHRGYLPHFDSSGVIQHITYRLADALPAEVVRRLAALRTDVRNQWLEMERTLDLHHGSCVLRQPDCAELVVENWQHFDGQRYRLHGWVVMPNHVHVVLELAASVDLRTVVQSWKSYTARRILAMAPPGAFARNQVWQPDYFDRFIRNPDHYAATLRYLAANPIKAGLVREAKDWPWLRC
jgi:REP element-mobilizing transposase RayT